MTISQKKSLLLFLIAMMLFAMLSVFIITRNNNATAATTSFRFVVIGDSRGSTSAINETTLRNLMSKVKGLSVQPSFVLFTGDQVNGGADVANQLTIWKNVMDDYYPITSIYPSLGNHENDETIFSNAFPHLTSNQLSGYQRSAYYFDYGNIRIITLNSNRRDGNGKFIIDSSQQTWLRSVLQNNGMTHNIVQFHVPPYPIGHHYGTSLDANVVQRDAVWNILDANNVTAVLVGHEHNYNRRKIDSTFNNNGYVFENSIYQVTIGGGGAPLSSTNTDSTNVEVGPIASYQFTVVDIADENATFTTYDINYNQIDSFTVIRGEGNSNPIPAATTISFQNGVYPSTNYSGNYDTYISQESAATNFGSSTILFVDGDNPIGSSKDLSTILKWDTSNIPIGKTISSASISFYVSDSTNQIYELYQMKRNWSEKESTWNQYAIGSNWASAGSKGSIDRGTTVLGTIVPTNVGTYSFHLNSSGVAVVQSWINNPFANYGVFISHSGNTNGMDIRSSEFSIANNRPKLTVTYYEESPKPIQTPAPTPVLITTSFQNGVYPSTSYAGNYDTYISENNKITNYGMSSVLLADGDDPVASTKDITAIIKWDTSSIPVGKTVRTASISFYVADASTQTYELFQMMRNWSEYGATWSENRSNSNWAIAGAKGATDRGTNILGTMNASNIGINTINLNSSGKALVQTWIDSPSTNYGLIIINNSNTNGIDIRSSEYSTNSSRPKLTVTYN